MHALGSLAGFLSSVAILLGTRRNPLVASIHGYWLFHSKAVVSFLIIRRSVVVLVVVLVSHGLLENVGTLSMMRWLLSESS